MRSDSPCSWSFYKLQITESSKFDREILQSLIRLVDDEHVEEDVEFLNIDVGFGVDGIGESSKLHDASQFRNEIIFAGVQRTSRFRKVELVLSMSSAHVLSVIRSAQTSSISPAEFFLAN